MADGVNIMLPFLPKYNAGERFWRGPLIRDIMKSFSIENDFKWTLIGIEIYADGTTLSRSYSQSVCVLRLQLFNIKLRSSHLHNIGIMPISDENPGLSVLRRAEQKVQFSKRYLIALQWPTILASNG